MKRVNKEYVNLNDCKKCRYHQGMRGTFVRCSSVDGVIALAVSMPANWQKGFTNDMVIVQCDEEVN